MTFGLRTGVTLVAAHLLVGCAAPQPRILPICNLRCSSAEQCGPTHSVSTSEVESLVRRLRSSFPVWSIEVAAVTSGYAVLVASDAADADLRHSWKAMGCFTPTVPPTQADYARLEQCVSGMVAWTKYSTVNDVPSLLLNPAFRRTCMNSTD
jgi:hypothetical protein